MLLLGVLFVSFSCVSDNSLGIEEPTEDGGFGDDVYVLNFAVTLDNLGYSSTRAITDSDPARITKYENYINLERFRILFFDSNGKFLFESKNRWVKQIDIKGGYSGWYVSVPFGPFGDDSYGEGKEYDWELIRDRLTSASFKVAILANRPAHLRYPGNFADSELELPNGVFDNDGPYWGPEHTGKKDIFELHHYQYDIIYADKGLHSTPNAAYYDFVMGDIKTDRPTMGSAINWVSFDNDDNDKVMLTSSVAMRHIKMPSEEHPIPMYGIQQFAPIPKDVWKKGSPFDLSNLQTDIHKIDVAEYNAKSVSLLRSCVRLDLVIPKTVKNGAKPQHISLWYSNIYSRTEPMDTWTPTDELWKDHDTECEWKAILDYGPISSKVFSGGNGDTKDAYQKRLSWFYGVWQEKGWQFKTLTGGKVTPPAVGGSIPAYPHIYNPCIQRNKVITCERAYVPEYNDNYHHYVVYTGERNINDPNTLPDMTKNPYIACFVISWDNSKYYCIPLLNYNENKDSDISSIFGPHSDNVAANAQWPAAMTTYMNTIPSKQGNQVPYPLLRNHIYRFTLTNSKTRADGEIEDIGISSEVLKTFDIDFSEQVKRSQLKQ